MIAESVTVAGNVEIGLEGDEAPRTVTLDLRNTKPAFLEPEEARRVADVLHDYADKADRGGTS